MSIEIIAEAAQGFEGDATLARLLARAAARSGADAVKFQLVYADDSATPAYQYYDFYKKLEMPMEVWQSVATEIKDGGAKLYLDIGGERALQEAVYLRADGVKIHTTNFYNNKLVRAALDSMPRVFISFGGVSAEELEEFLDFHKIVPCEQICLMYGFQAEPTPIESNNLRRLEALKKRFAGFRFGFMDHSDGGSNEAINLALMALPFGIDCIEKHITLDRALQIEDYVSGLAPEKFKQFARNIRELEPALGDGSLELTSLEQKYRYKSMKVVIAVREIREGETLKLADLDLKLTNHPSPPLSIFKLDKAVNRTLVVDVKPKQPIMEDMLS